MFSFLLELLTCSLSAGRGELEPLPSISCHCNCCCYSFFGCLWVWITGGQFFHLVILCYSITFYMDNNNIAITVVGNTAPSSESTLVTAEEEGETNSVTTPSSSTVIKFISGLVVDEGEDDDEDDMDEMSLSVVNCCGDGDCEDHESLDDGGGTIGDDGDASKSVKGQRKRDRRAAKLKKEAQKEVEWDIVPVESAAARAARLDVRRKINDDYVADLRHKGLHNLSGEIDRCLKKVSEGVETFEDIWQKVHNATNTNQKEKYEADLKKEIKKLQRLRDQIKSWIASGEIKDKSTLVDTRKLIETQMERFKVVERETKTKAYSKEGLGAAQKLDPTTREREDLNNWLISAIDSMQIQIDSFECEIESILAAKKKRLDKDKQDRLDELKTFLERHRFHVTKLETLMRMLDNLAADVNAVSLRTFLSQVKKIKDDIDYYLESSQEAEFEVNEFIYDDIDGLDEFDDGLVGQPVGGGTGEEGTEEELPISITTTSGNNSPISPVHSSDASDPEKRRKSSDDVSVKVVRPVAVKAVVQSNHSPSPVGVGGGKAVGAVGTPPKGVGTPNNSSPSSGLSNHVSSLSSLSSSPTHNYHNALNNSKSIGHPDLTEHNDGSSTTGGLCFRGLSKSPVMDSSIIRGPLGGMSTVNGILENGNGSPTDEDHSSPHTQLLTSCSTPITGSSLTMENGLISSSPPQETTCSNNNNNILLMSSSSSTEISGVNERPSSHSSQQLQLQQQHQLFGDSSSLLSSTMESLSNSSSLQQPSSYIQQAFNGLGSVTGAASNLSEGFASNLGVSSNSLISSINNSSGSNSCSVLGDTSNVIGLPNIIGVSSGGIQQISSTGDQISSALVCGGGGESATTTTTASVDISSSSSGGVTMFATTSNTSSSLSASSAGVSSSHNNSNSGILSQQHIHQLQQLQQHQGPISQCGTNLEPNISEYLRLQSQDQILFNRILSESDSMASLKSMAQDVLDRSGLSLGDNSKNLSESKTREAHIPPLLGVAPLGPVPLQKEHQLQFQMMEAAHQHLPVSADSERMRQFLPRNPYPTPLYYPQHPLSNSDTFEFFNRLSIETLFFIFYYLEGTKAQYLAAKVLKKQSWRFHTKYMMWFQRHEEPKVINEEYEQGTYVYFDIEKWGQRKKDGFVFEYRYLEDRDLG
ncbi:CCR4-NOT transcription complex subunit 3 isoform X3 [Folsomia candida]|uniref:CCR4-NOT transcription complex subunit 3 isoform X3 n=1 Tax=Folsomia candida TaxID=158441 RepID=UPI00160509C7|nr:CCR4-NOT transcription complex subunit 3 isoform X3 [Folsomia candida]